MAPCFKTDKHCTVPRQKCVNDESLGFGNASAFRWQHGPTAEHTALHFLRHSASSVSVSSSSGRKTRSSQFNSASNITDSSASGNAILCVESSRGTKRIYRAGKGETAASSFEVEDEHQSLQFRLTSLLKDYLMPQGYPDTVSPQYAGYMFWRGVQYVFGGAISVYTTKCLFSALGVAGKHSGEAAAAVNWVVKEGAGRIGRFLFGRYGRELDCELKQFRLTGDLVMAFGAALELSTALLPKAFLPLACTANISKNLAAVAACSTRAPVYKSFARSNNMADITAKGESVANIADIVGTVLGVLLTKSSLPLLPTVGVLTLGYLCSSYQEVATVELPYLNFARLGYSTDKFLATGSVPPIKETNKSEPLVLYGGKNRSRIVLGAQVKQAFTCYEDLRVAASSFEQERFILTYRPDKKKAFILLKEGATSNDVLKASVGAHLLLKLVDGEQSFYMDQLIGHSCDNIGNENITRWQAALSYTHDSLDKVFVEFSRQATLKGWELQHTMLNPKDTRLVQLGTTARPLKL